VFLDYLNLGHLEFLGYLEVPECLENYLMILEDPEHLAYLVFPEVLEILVLHQNHQHPESLADY
jgi:hypothetical protein